MNFGLPIDDFFSSLVLQNQLVNYARQHQQDDEDERFILYDLGLPSSSGILSSSSRKMTPFERYMHLEEQSSTYMKQGKYFEAYGLLKTQHELGPKIHFASVLIKYYVSLMQTDRLENAKKIRDELCALLEEKFNDSCEEVCEYAEHLRKQNKFMEAVLFYQVSFHLCEKEKHLPTITTLSQKISSGLRESCKSLYDVTSINKQTIKSYFIPLLQRIKAFVKESMIVNMKLSSLIQGVCSQNIQFCQFLIGDMKEQEETLNEAIACMEQCHNGDEVEFRVYGELMATLGAVYAITDRSVESVKLLNQAVNALKKARDFDSPMEMASQIKNLEKGLQAVQKKV